MSSRPPRATSSTCQPVADGYVERDGVKVHYELFGAGEPTVLLLLGFDREVLPIRSALRRVGVLIRQLDEGSTALRRTEDAGMPTGR